MAYQAQNKTKVYRMTIFKKLYECFMPISVAYEALPGTNEYVVTTFYRMRRPRKTVFRPANEKAKQAALRYYETMGQKIRRTR